MFSYEPLLIQLVKRKMSREKLRQGIGASYATMARISKNEYVQMEILNRICGFLNVPIQDVIEFIPDNGENL